MREWFTKEEKLTEVLVKHAIAHYVQGYVDPRDAGSLYDCTILVPQTYELKHDKRAIETGNLYFEIRNTRQQAPSGLTATRADFWAHYIPPPWQCIALYAPQKMMEFLQQQLTSQHTGYRLTSPHGGDQNSQGIVAPIADILSQPFVQHIPFRLELPEAFSTSGLVGRCNECNRTLAIEVFRGGLCFSCQRTPLQPEEPTHA